MAGDHAFEFVRVDVKARHQDHVLLAVDNFHGAIQRHDADVARAEEAVRRHDLVGFFLLVPVAQHDLRAADRNLAGLPWRQIRAGVVDDGDIGRRHRQADGAGKFVAVGAVAGGHRRRFGQPVPFDDGHARQLAPLVGDRLLHRHPAAIAHAQAGKIEVGKTGVVHQRVVERIDRREHVDAVLAQFLHEARDVARVDDQDVQRAHAHAPHGARGQREDVIQRQRAHDRERLAARFAQYRA